MNNNDMKYKCPHCKQECTGRPPIKGAIEDKACCPNCGRMFDKEAAIVLGADSNQESTEKGQNQSRLFNDNNDGTVTDNATHLIWQKDDDNQRRNWHDATKYASSLSLAGRSDWRLPSDKELLALWNRVAASDETKKTYFPGMKPKGHWSSTTNPYGPDEAYVVTLDRGGRFSVTKMDNDGGYFVRCVRSDEAERKRQQEEARRAEEAKRAEAAKRAEEIRRTEEARKRQIQSKRESDRVCVMCGKPLGIFQRLGGAKHHKECGTFSE